jgi:hypothetical protein
MTFLHILIYNITSLNCECYLLHKNNIHASGYNKKEAIINLLYMLRKNNYILDTVVDDDKNIYSHNEIEYIDMEKCWNKMHYAYTKETMTIII